VSAWPVPGTRTSIVSDLERKKTTIAGKSRRSTRFDCIFLVLQLSINKLSVCAKQFLSYHTALMHFF
jgi:hypothetical protein